jgi:hypothetical protein
MVAVVVLLDQQIDLLIDKQGQGNIVELLMIVLYL